MSVKCMVCKEDFSLITSQHLKRHNLTSKQYCELFPSASLSSSEFCRTMTVATKLAYALDPTRGERISATLHQTNLDNPNVNVCRSDSMKEVWKSTEHQERVKKGQERYWSDPVNRASFKKIMEAVRARPGWAEAIATTMKNHWANQSYHDQISATQKKRWENPEVHKNVSAALTRWWSDPQHHEELVIALAEVRQREGYGVGISRKMKEWWADPVWSANTLKASREGITRLGPNFSELRLKEILDTNFPGLFKFNGNGKDVTIIGRKIPDFVFTQNQKIVIEMFGIFWHLLGSETALLDFYRKHGYSAEVFWEDVVWCDEATIITRTQKLLEEK